MLSRYQVSDFCECTRLETREREEESRVSRLLYDSEREEIAAVDCSETSMSARDIFHYGSMPEQKPHVEYRAQSGSGRLRIA